MDAKEKKHLQVFGYGLAIIISLIVLRLAFKHQALTPGKMVALVSAFSLAVVTYSRLQTIKPLYRIWMKGARFIGEIVNFVLLAMIFYTMFTITALIMKMCRKRFLDLKIDKSAKTYWQIKSCGEFDRERYIKQF